jgi:hypothetical protein
VVIIGDIIAIGEISSEKGGLSLAAFLFAPYRDVGCQRPAPSLHCLQVLSAVNAVSVRLFRGGGGWGSRWSGGWGRR